MLTRENESLRVHVKHFNQLQELATMLQESHKSVAYSLLSPFSAWPAEAAVINDSHVIDVGSILKSPSKTFLIEHYHFFSQLFW